MTITVTPIANNQTFGAWLSTTNRLANIISQNTVTSDSSSGGSLTTGNVYVNGHFGAGYLFAETALIGGNVSTNSTLNVLANVNFTYSAANLTSITANSTTSNLTIRTENTAIVGNTLFINATINAVSSANLSGAVAIANTLSVSNAATFSDVINVENVLPLVSATFDLGSTTNLFKNTYTQTVLFATGSANSTQYTGTANNANNFNGQPASFYANATNITSGTLATARLPATVNVTTLNASTVNTVNIVANGSTGVAGQVVTSNGTGIYWSTPQAGVTSVASGNGLSGGPITSTGTLVVAQGTGTVVNATGVHVNAAYIGTLTANNANNLNGQPASFYANATNITTGTLATARLPATINATSINVNTVSITNTLTVGTNSTFNALIRSSSIIPLANSLHALGNSSNYFEIAYIGLVDLGSGAQITSTQYTGTANNANNLNGQAPSFYTNATNLTTGTVPSARLPAGSTTQSGIVQLIDSVSNTSITLAATANSVKTVFDYAASIAATGTPPSPSNTFVQFNNSGAFGGSAAFTFNNATNTVTVGAQLQVGANVIADTSALRIGNSTVNTAISAGTISLNGVNVNNAITGNAATAYTNAINIAASLYQTTAGLSANVATLTSNNSTNLNGQPASFYTNASNISAGTLPAARLTGSYTITASNATNLNNQPDTFYTNASNISAGTLPAGRLTGTYAITANNATNLNGQPDTFYTNATNITSGTLATARLPATVNVDTQINVGTNVGLSTDTLRIGNSSVNTAISAGSLTFNGVNVNTAITGNAATAYTNAITIAANATNITSGTLATARLPATVNVATQVNVGANVGLSTDFLRIGNSSVNVAISAATITLNGVNVNTAITGNASTAYTNAITIAANATNLTSGTVATARLGSGTANSTTFLAGDQSYKTAVTSVATGNGISGGTITGTGTLVAVQGTGTVVNATGIHVNATYISTIAANSATGSLTNTFTVGTASYFVANGNLGIGTASPSTKLHVVGDTLLVGSVTTNGVINVVGSIGGPTTEGGQISVYHPNTANAILHVDAYSTKISRIFQDNMADGVMEIGQLLNTSNGTVDIYTGNYSRTARFRSNEISFNAPITIGSSGTLTRVAWVNFSGTLTVTIRASSGISSITDNGTGIYTANFTTSFPDENFAFAGSAKIDSTSTVAPQLQNNQLNKSTSGVAIETLDSGFGRTDAQSIDLIVVR